MADVFEDSEDDGFYDVFGLSDKDDYEHKNANDSNLARTETNKDEDNDEDLGHMFINEELSSASLLKKLAESDNIYIRREAARNAVVILFEVVASKDSHELHSVVSTLCKLSQDAEPLVRSELAEFIPSIAKLCRQNTPDLDFLLRQQIIPITVRLTIDDPQIQVRKAGQAALLSLLEKGLVSDVLLSEWICPLVAQQTKVTDVSEEYRIEAVTLLCKMTPLVGKEIAEKHFLETFASLCTDSAVCIKEVCAANFGQFCKAVGTESTELILVPEFLNLCSSKLWRLRKIIAESFVDVASVVEMKTKHEILTAIFLKLLCDDMQWVRMSAYQSLGGFIATFADPEKTGLQYNEDGTFSVINNNCVRRNRRGSNFSNDITFNSYSSHLDNNLECSAAVKNGNDDSQSTFTQDNLELHSKTRFDKGGFKRSSRLLREFFTNTVADNKVSEVNTDESLQTLKNRKVKSEISNESGDFKEPVQITEGEKEIKQKETLSLHTSSQVVPKLIEKYSTVLRTRKDSCKESSLSVTSSNGGHLHLYIDNDNVFNHFQYWRMPIPEIELDVDLEDGKATNIHVRTKARDDSEDKICTSDINLKILSSTKEKPLSFGPTLLNKSIRTEKQADSSHILIQTACINTIAPNYTSEQFSSMHEESNVVHSSYDEASVTVKQGEILDIIQSHNDICGLDSKAVLHPMRHHALSVDSLSSEESVSSYEQDIVPPELLDRYISLGDPQYSKTVNSEIIHYCAYSFPAVVYTLGRQYWPCLRKVCETLSFDIQWKVRKTIASCLHELALILGPEITARDLLPIFLILVKDIEEVRIGIVNHLTQFLLLLQPKARKDFLPIIEEILESDEKNWRFRSALAEQMNSLVQAEIYSLSEVKNYIMPIGMLLIRDRVCEVRQVTVQLIAIILKKLSDCESLDAENFLSTLNEKFRLARKWLWRLMYVYLCEKFAETEALSMEMYVNQVVPNLFALTSDRVPNVRLAVARCISSTLLPHGYFPMIQEVHQQLSLQVLYTLQNDNDKDVKYFACLCAEAFGITPEHMMSTV